MATLSHKSQADLDAERKARVERAYELADARERKHPGEKPMLTTARSLHYSVRKNHHEDAFNHCRDLARQLFEYGCRTPLVDDMAYEPLDPPICHAVLVVEALERIDQDANWAIAQAYVRVLALMQSLFKGQILARVTLRDGVNRAIRAAEEVNKPQSNANFDDL